MRRVTPEQIKPGQVLRIIHWFKPRGARERYSVTFKGTVRRVYLNIPYPHVIFEEESGEGYPDIVLRDSTMERVDLDLIAEAPDPRLDVVTEVLVDGWVSEQRARMVAGRVLDALDRQSDG